MDSLTSTTSPKFFSRSTLIIAVFCALLWLVANTYIASHFSLYGTDSIMYRLPIAAATHPFHLGIPFLDNFEGYGNAWGHQWPGSMLLMSGIFALIPYHQETDIFIHLLMLLGVGILSGVSVWRLTGNRGLACLTTVLVSSDRIVLSGVTARIELPGILTLATIMTYCTLFLSANASRTWKGIALIAAFVAAIVHPYSMLLVGLLLFCIGIHSWFTYRKSLKFTFLLFGAFFLGLLSLAAWFLLQPAALSQFTTNLSLQKSFYTTYNSVIQGLINYRYGFGYLAWAWAGLVSLVIVLSWQRIASDSPETATQRRAIQFCALTFLALVTIHTITKCENFNYLGFGAPLTSILMAVSVAFLAKRLPKVLAFFPTLIFVILTLLAFSVYPFRTYQYWRAGCPNLNAKVAGMVTALPVNSTVYIPPCLWPVACKDHDRNYRFATFFVASKAEARQQYESATYRTAKKGDFLIVDEIATRGPDKFGLAPTFKTTPPDTNYWEFYHREKQLFPGKVSWGFDLSIYRFKGAPLPASTNNN